MASFELEFDLSEFQERLNNYSKNLENELREAWPEIVEQCIMDVRSRAPDKETEYRHIMDSQIGLSGDVSADPDPPRQRFDRFPGMWLEDLVIQPGSYTYSSEDFTMSLGVPEFLHEFSGFSYTNVRGRKVRWGTVIDPGEPITHSTPYGVWAFFEFGENHEIVPKFGDYYLNPDGTQQSRVPAMIKSYPAFRMYTDFNRAIFDAAVLEVANTVEL